MNFKFDEKQQGLRFNEGWTTSKFHEVTEELLEGEMISGFRGYIDSSGILRSIAMKIKL